MCIEYESQQHERLASGLVLGKQRHPSDIVQLLESANLLIKKCVRLSNNAWFLSKFLEWYMFCIIKIFCFNIESLEYDKLKSGNKDDSTGSARPLS